MNEDLEKIYQEQLEEELIQFISKSKQISLDKAMSAYYESKLADKITKGEYGIQYLDYRVLAEILSETEPELFPEW